VVEPIEQNEETRWKLIAQVKEMKSAFLKVGIALIVLIVAWRVSAYGLGQLLRHSINEPSENLKMIIIFSLNSLPLYLIAFPLMLLVLKKTPDTKIEKSKLSFGKFFIFIPICFAAMYVGNIISVLINLGISALKGSPVINPLETLPKTNFFILVLFVGVLAPIMEEVIFRGVLINKLRKYGDTVCIFASGIAFGLFHANLSQMIYAFFLGLILAYIVVKTGKLIYSIILHIAINMFSAVLMSVLSKVDEAGKLIVSGVAGIFVLGMLASGITLFCVNLKKINLQNSRAEYSPARKIKMLILSPSMLVYILICTALIIQVILL